MKLALTAISLLAVATFLVSCSEEDGPSLPHNDDVQGLHSDVATSKDGPNGVKLNNGRKWEMDDHTRSVFAKMAGTFLSSDHASLQGEGLKNAGAALQVQIHELIQGCTMTGEAHDQLHVYLTGYIPAVAALSESGQIKEAQTVKHYLESYSEYFE